MAPRGMKKAQARTARTACAIRTWFSVWKVAEVNSDWGLAVLPLPVPVPVPVPLPPPEPGLEPPV